MESMIEQKSILIVLVNYFNENEVAEFIARQLCKQQVQYTVVVVDNGSNANVLEQPGKDNAFVHLVQPTENLGYLNGANFGFNFYCASNPIPDFTIVCNSDIIIEDEHFFEKLLNDSASEKAEVIGPTIVSTLTSHHQNPMYKKRLSYMKIKRLLTVFSFYPLYIIYQLGAYFKRWIKISRSENEKQSDLVYALHGSFLIFTKSFFEKGNTLQFPSFLYAEELFIAEQCLKNGSSIYYNANLKVLHKEHSSSGFIKNRKHVKWMKESLNVIYNSYYK